MAKRRQKLHPDTVERRVQEGRGSGRSQDYKPWLTIHDVPSQGLCHRKFGWKTQRMHHLLSNQELHYFYALEWSRRVIDIREQYPLLPLETTLDIARQLGVKHPTDPQNKHPVVMTSDFLITVTGTDGPIDQARTVKLEANLSQPRTLEKLEIERLYWQSSNVSWGIVTQNEIPSGLIKNMQILHDYYQLDECSPQQIQSVLHFLETYRDSRTISFIDIAKESDEYHKYAIGTSLSIMWHLIATKNISVDINKSINPSKPLDFTI